MSVQNIIAGTKTNTSSKKGDDSSAVLQLHKTRDNLRSHLTSSTKCTTIHPSQNNILKETQRVHMFVMNPFNA